MNPLPLAHEENEVLRHAVREVLAVRQGAAFPAQAIRKRIEHEMLIDFKINDDNVTVAAQFLAGLPTPQAKNATAPLGSTVYWLITSEGVLAHERRGQLL